jgi:DHA2 family multidrug resistance protein
MSETAVKFASGTERSRRSEVSAVAPEALGTQNEPLSVVEYGRRRLIIVVGIMMAALLQTLDSTIVNVALPTIEGNIGASIDEGTWIVTGYIISNVIVIPLAPFLLTRLGRRQYYALSIIGFTLASVLCGTAKSLAVLVFYRIVQGAFGGGLIATSQIVLRDTFPPEKLGASSALFAIALTSGPALGPLLGGVLTDQFSWPWVFEINLVPGAIAAAIMLAMLRNPVAPKYVPFDGSGIVLLAVGLGSLQYVLDEGERSDWFDSAGILFCAVTCVVGLVTFVLWEVKARRPIVDVRALANRNLAVGCCTAILLGMVNFGPNIMMPQYAQAILGFTATLSGQLMLIRALPVVLLTPLVARFAARTDPRVLIATGAVIAGASLAVVGANMTTGSDFFALAPALFFSGIGQAMVFVPLLVMVLSSVPLRRSATASSLISLSFNMGASIASTTLITIFDRRTYFHAEIYRASATLGNPLVARASATPHALRALALLVNQQASNAGFADSIYSLVTVAGAAACCAMLMKRRAKSAPPVRVVGTD